MGIHIIKIPDIGEGIAEVELLEWHVGPGDTVHEDQLLADVMTDKATVEVPSPVVGTVVSLGGQVGDVMAVGSELIRLEIEGVGNFVETSLPPSSAASPAAPSQVVESGGAGGLQTQREPAVYPDSASDFGPTLGADEEPASAPVAGSEATARPEPVTRIPGASSTDFPSAARQGAGALRQPAENPLASPAVRQRAADQGIDLRYVDRKSPRLNSRP